MFDDTKVFPRTLTYNSNTNNRLQPHQILHKDLIITVNM